MNLNDRTDIMTVGTMIEVIYGRVEPYSEILKMASERIILPLYEAMESRSIITELIYHGCILLGYPC
ncbi:hypothetical protein OO184_22740 [Photorhabdus sp. APURE]|uniref:hypothetical protein n=1 Tax=Photorhabdus aballayi TaxID=2991723 RepID=UPI00223DDB29|nr:hypothetical protein [Photorhabdus aballayi]MCW7550670.1 hypothetical protein [Photorhabdus aballayi]